ncbi:MAG: sigma-70 family RNA polymerase sigma factor [Candidatus Vogelbacteria bacterium]
MVNEANLPLLRQQFSILKVMESEKFGQLMSQYLSPVYNFVYRLTGGADLANDITQETFIKVWKNLKRFDETKSFKPWLFAIARNTAIDWLRKRRLIPFSDLKDQEDNESFENKISDPLPLPDELFRRAELASLLEDALAKLAINDRTIILLHHLENLTFTEIAKIINQPMNTTKSRYRRTLTALRQFLLTAPK